MLFKTVPAFRLHSYPVLYAKPGDCVVHFKFTVLILPSGPTRITGIALDLDSIRSDKNVDSEVNVILAQATKVKADVPSRTKLESTEKKEETA